MADYARYAVYYTPGGDLARWGAEWLGWNPEAGRAVAQPEVPGLDLPAATEAPRKYGFHATMKAPFRPAEGIAARDLVGALAAFCAGEAPVPLDGGLVPARLGGFVALIPARDSVALHALEARLVEAMDGLRAPLTDAEVARRRPETLTPRQRDNLHRWGYPFVRDEFRFHMTLSGDLAPPAADRLLAAVRDRLPGLPDPYPVDALSLMGEDDEGRFRLLARLDLRG